MPKKITRTSDLVPDKRNANRGTERGGSLLENSLRKYGAGRSILIDKKGQIIAGNKTAEKAVELGIEKVRIVETRGDELVVVQRIDLDLSTDKAARELAIADNRIGALDLDFDTEEILRLADEQIDLAGVGFSDLELNDLREKLGAESKEIEHPAGLQFRVIVECDSEKHQAKLLKKFEKEGLRCHALIL